VTNKKILVFGFKSHGKYKTNISEIIVNKIKNNKINEKTILSTNFNNDKIIKKIKEIKPDVILGIGQHPRARMIRIERKTKNLIKRKKDKKSKPINQNSSKELFTNLKIDKTKETTIAYNAGTYVCNFTMFNIMEYIIKNNKDTKFTFLHIPKNYDIRKAINAINKIINNIKK